MNSKDKEIKKLEAKLKELNSKNTKNIISSNKNENNISNISRMMKSKSKINSTLYSISQDELENNNKYKFDEFNNIYKDNINDEIININENKNITMSNFKSSRNYNYFTIFNKKGNKKNNMSQQNSIINIKSYTKKNFGTNNLRKNKTKSSRKNNSIDLNRKKKEIRKKLQNSNSFLNITSNTFNLNKNNIMINLNPKNVNMNIENLKVKKKLHEYQKLIDQKLIQLIKRHQPYSKNNKTMLHIHRNSSPNFDINIKNSQQKNSPLLGLDVIKKINKNKINIKSNSKKHNENKNNKSIKSISIIDSKRRRNISKNIKKNTSINNSKSINNMKLILNKVSFNSKLGDFNSSRQYNESMLTNEKSFLSLKKYIFAKNNNSQSNTIKC